MGNSVVYRLESEKELLDERIEKLSNFLGQEHDFLSVQHRKLLEMQLEAMNKYSCILRKRLEILVSE